MHLQMTLIYSRHIINLIPNWFDTVFLNRKTLARAALLITKSSNPGQKHSPNFLWVSPLCHFATRKLAICFEIVQKRHIYTLLQTFDNLEVGNITPARFSCSHTQWHTGCSGWFASHSWMAQRGEANNQRTCLSRWLVGKAESKNLFRADATQLSLELVGTTTFHCTSRFSPFGVQVYTFYIVQLCVTNY